MSLTLSQSPIRPSHSHQRINQSLPSRHHLSMKKRQTLPLRKWQIRKTKSTSSPHSPLLRRNLRHQPRYHLRLRNHRQALNHPHKLQQTRRPRSSNRSLIPAPWPLPPHPLLQFRSLKRLQTNQAQKSPRKRAHLVPYMIYWHRLWRLWKSRRSSSQEGQWCISFPLPKIKG